MNNKKLDFPESLEEYIKQKRDDMLNNFHRVLPTNELLFDRWEKGKYLNFGENSNIYDTSIIMGDVKVGKNVWIGPYTLLDAVNGSVEIGDWCAISSGVFIYTHDSSKYYLSSGTCPFVKGNIKIGNNTQIGSMSIIACGVTVGNHCVIGANSFVNKDIPDYSIACGTPAKVIGEVIIKNNDIEFKYFNK